MQDGFVFSSADFVDHLINNAVLTFIYLYTHVVAWYLLGQAM